MSLRTSRKSTASRAGRRQGGYHRRLGAQLCVAGGDLRRYESGLPLCSDASRSSLLEGARKCYTAAARLVPDDGRSHNCLGVLAQTDGDGPLGAAYGFVRAMGQEGQFGRTKERGPKPQLAPSARVEEIREQACGVRGSKKEEQQQRGAARGGRGGRGGRSASSSSILSPIQLSEFDAPWLARADRATCGPRLRLRPYFCRFEVVAASRRMGDER